VVRLFLEREQLPPSGRARHRRRRQAGWTRPGSIPGPLRGDA
jgi:hypothetical protein